MESLPTKTDQDVFEAIIECDLEESINPHGLERCVVSSSEIAKWMNISRYRARKSLNLLVRAGLVEKASVGCPAVYSYGEITELEWESGPPKNGYALTDKAFKTEEYKASDAKQMLELAKLANVNGEEAFIIHGEMA